MHARKNYFFIFPETINLSIEQFRITHSLGVIVIHQNCCVKIDNCCRYNVFTSHGPDLYGTEPASFYLLNGLLNFNLAFPAALVVIPVQLLLASMLRKEAPADTRHPHLLSQVADSLNQCCAPVPSPSPPLSAPGLPFWWQWLFKLTKFI